MGTGKQQCVMRCLVDCLCGSFSYGFDNHECYMYNHDLMPEQDDYEDVTGLDYFAGYNINSEEQGARG